ncbi:MAG: hypothetical protein L0Y72_04260 [Gemmataceae bacterium]|nr:hypothetical protein [Gemmataceae bacterium]MCI0738233.1 hypothetical protein [Gemmataceae bacterium]
MFRQSWRLAYIFVIFAFPSACVAQPSAPKSQTLSAHYQDLLESDGEKAFRAMRRLAAMPTDTLQFLRDNVRPAAKTATPEDIQKLIHQLDSERFAERDKAGQELERLDWQAMDAVRKAAKEGGTLERKRRLEQLIARAEGPLTGSKLRWQRAVEVVDWIGTAEAKALMERWGQGAAGSQLTQDANKALKRWASVSRAALPAVKATTDAQGDPLPVGAILRIGSTRWRLEERDSGSIFYTSDGKRLIVIGDVILGVVNVADGKILIRQESNRYGGWSAQSARLTPDGKRLVAAGFSYGNDMRIPSVRVFDVDGLKEISHWPVEGDVLGFAEKANVALLRTEKGIQQFDIDAGRNLEFFPLPKDTRGPVWAIHGKTAVVATAKQDHFLVYDVTAPERAKTLVFPDRLPSSFAFSPDGKTLACGAHYDWGLILYDVESGKPIRHIRPRGAARTEVRSLVFSPDGKTLMFTSNELEKRYGDGELVAWDMEQHKPRWKTSGGGTAFVFSPDGCFIAGKSGVLSTARLSVWDAATGKEITGYAEPAAAFTSELAFSADGQSILTVQRNAARIWDFPSGKALKEFNHPTVPRADLAKVDRAALSPDGRRLATSSHNRDLRIWDTQTGRELLKLPDSGFQSGFARNFMFTQDGSRLCTWEANCRLRVWDVATGRLLGEHLPRPEGFPKELDENDDIRRQRGLRDKTFTLGSDVCFFPDGSRFLWHFNKLRVYDAASGKEMQSLAEDIDMGYYRPEVSADGEWLLIGGGSDQPRTLVNLRLGKKFGQVQVAGGRSGAPALSPDGRCFALDTSAGANRRILIYETASLQPRLAIPLEYGYAYRLAFSPDGRFLAAALIDGTVLVWDVRSLEL